MTTSTALNLETISTSAASSPTLRPAILLVDDDRVTRMLLRESLHNHGYEVILAKHGAEALEVLIEHSVRIEAVVLDREMPSMNGMEVVSRMKSEPQLAGIPIIMLTGSGELEKIQEGINAGVYYYLVKPIDNTLLYSVIDSALRERSQTRALIAELGRHSQALKAMQSCHLQVRTISEAEDTASFLASCFPNPERVVAGLLELLINAVEHGNLQISFEEKTRLLNQGFWRDEIDRRACLPENAGKSVQVRYQLSGEGHLVQITDCGTGFDWKRYWHIDPARATASHGRGIARARLMAFDRLSYNDTGNQVSVLVAAVPISFKDYAW
jgi:CheY-like chemotaxis protein